VSDDFIDPWSIPLLRWAGSKRRLLAQLLDHVPENFSRYVEPFAGSACLFFALRPSRAVLGDLNRELMETYKIIRQHPRLVSRAARTHANTKAMYYRLRALDPKLLKPIERAARFVYLNRNCFNGVYRVNRDGQFNVPRGTRTGRLPSESQFYRCSIALRAVDFRPGDYRSCLGDVRSGDFVYLDPPYASKRRNRLGEYGYDCFEESDLPQLFDCLRGIDQVGAHFLLSYCTHRAIKALPGDWQCRTLNVRRHVAGFARHRRTVREVLISNIQ
jgi:DNA adenine methylase